MTPVIEQYMDFLTLTKLSNIIITQAKIPIKRRRRKTPPMNLTEQEQYVQFLAPIKKTNLGFAQVNS